MTGRRSTSSAETPQRWGGELHSGSLRRFGRAFTLIELVVSISVGVIISGIAAGMIWNASSQRTAISARAELTDVGSAAMEVLLRYLREIPQDECPEESTPCLQGHARITVATVTELRYGTICFRYRAADSVVEMSDDSGGSWQPLVRDVAGLDLSYFDRSGASLAPLPLSETNREGVRRISVDLRLSRGGESAHLRCSVFLRNFMNEVQTDVGS